MYYASLGHEVAAMTFWHETERVSRFGQAPPKTPRVLTRKLRLLKSARTWDPQKIDKRSIPFLGDISVLHPYSRCSQCLSILDGSAMQILKSYI